MSLVAQCLRGSGPVPRSKIRFRLKARENKSGELRAAHIAVVPASAAPRTPPGRQREERRAEWKTQRRQVRTPALYAPALLVSPHYWCPRIAVNIAVNIDRNWLQVIKVPGGAVLRGCKKTKRKLMAHFQLRAGIHSQLRVLASLYVLRIFLTCLVGYSTPGLRACCKVVCRTRGTDQRRGKVNGQQPCERQLNKRRATRPAGWKPPAGQVEPRLVRPAWSQQRDQPVRGMMWCPVVAPRKSPQAPRSSQAASQAAASEPGPSTPLPAKRTKAEPEAAEPTKGKGKAAKAKPAPQPGRWLDRDCNAALNMQRIGESRWRPLELCYWPEQGALPAKGKEYPGLGYKRLRDKPPKAQQQQAPPI
ncbi:hypothetical protein QJQ45_027785 [Haematococcus lacustris]|nr:hypothetical protein QJQ45_027785 [Haematococcus lacustris]